MRIIYLMASHFSKPYREESLYYSLLSIRNNTVHPSCVYLSYSTVTGTEMEESKKQKLIEAMLPIPLYIYFQGTQKFQFQHYDKLTKFVEDDDIVCFQDDDDMCYPEKIEQIQKYFEKYPNSILVKHLTSTFLEMGSEMAKFPIEANANRYCFSSFRNEHWAFAVKGKIFKEFFEYKIDSNLSLRETLVRNINNVNLLYVDLLFVEWIDINHGSFYTIPVPLIYYRRKFQST